MWNSHDVNYVNKCKKWCSGQTNRPIGLKFCMGIPNGVYLLFGNDESPLEEILENFDEMGYLMATKTLNGHNFWTNKDIDMGFSGLLLWRSRLLI